MSSYSLDAEKFINEIKKHKELWDLDVNGKPYRIKVKEQAWSSVAKIFIEDFDALSKAEKSEVYRKLYNKWRNIRDAYVRNVRGSRHHSQYIFMKQLSFLNRRYGPQRTKADDDEDDDDDAVDDDEAGERSRDSDDDAPSVIDNLKRRRLAGKTARIEIVDVPQSFDDGEPAAPAFDEDRSFFESLLPAVRELDLDHKLKFRFEVLRLIKNIRADARGGCKPEPSSERYAD